MAMTIAMDMALVLAGVGVGAGGWGWGRTKGMAKPFNKYHTIFYHVYCLGIGIVMPIKYFLFIFNILSILRSIASYRFISFFSSFLRLWQIKCAWFYDLLIFHYNFVNILLLLLLLLLTLTQTLMRRHSSYNRLTNTLHTWVSMSVRVWACVCVGVCAHSKPAPTASWYNFKRMFRALLSIWHNGRASSEGFDLSGCCCCLLLLVPPAAAAAA